MEKRLKIKTALCKTEPDRVYNINTNESLKEGTEITALCAIGQPEQFYQFLNNYKISKKITFDDHHQYVPEDIKEIKTTIVTTEKDAVKLKKFNFDNIYALKLKTTIDIEALLN